MAAQESRFPSRSHSLRERRRDGVDVVEAAKDSSKRMSGNANDEIRRPLPILGNPSTGLIAKPVSEVFDCALDGLARAERGRASFERR